MRAVAVAILLLAAVRFYDCAQTEDEENLVLRIGAALFAVDLWLIILGL